MSRFSKIPDAAFNPQLLHREVLLYVIEEFRGDIENLEYPAGRDAEKLVQYLIDRYGHKFRMYGSAQELLKNVKTFTNFPESHHFFAVPFAPYNVSPTIFYSLKNEKFICKSDLFVILQNMIFNDSDNENFITSIGITLKGYEAKLRDRLEFVRFKEEQLEEIKKEIDSVMKRERTKEMTDNVNKFLQNGNFGDVMIGLKSLYPNFAKDSQMVAQMREVYNETNFDNDPRMIELGQKSVQWTETILRVIQTHPEMFCPHSAVPNNRMPIAVRVFEDGDQRFVSVSELAYALMALKVSRPPLLLKMTDTMTLDDVQRKFETKNIEFIRYPIVRTKHRMVPVTIRVPPEIKLCVLAVDGLFELLREAIFSLKMFQSPIHPPHLIYQIREQCIYENKSPYFFYIGGLEKIRALWRNAQEGVTKTAVRNAKKDGFTVQNLKNELAHLGLTTTFPEIQDYAEVVYSEVDKIKKGDVLRTCDLFDALEHCQLNCIINHYEFLKEFLHNQKGCSRVMGYKCELCESEASNSEIKHQNREKNKKKKDKKKTKLAQKKSEEIEDATNASEFRMNDETSSEMATGSQKTAKVIIESSKTGKKDETVSDDRKTDAENLQMPAAVVPETKSSSEDQRSQKTSSNCDKCFRSCEMLNETKKELKSSENKLKNLEKKISAKERELEESKQKQEDEKKNLNKQISNLKSSISQTENDNLRKEKTQMDLEDQVSRLDKSLEIQNQKILDVNGAKMKLEENQMTLKKQVFQLEQELKDEKKKTLEYLKLSQKEKLKFEEQISEKNRKLEEFKESEIRMKAENDINQRMIQQLMDKLGSSGTSYSNPSTSGILKNSEVSTSSKMQKCEICWNELNEWESVKCHQCRRPFHIKCANSWLERYKTCPSCSGEFQDPPTRNHFSSFF